MKKKLLILILIIVFNLSACSNKNDLNKDNNLETNAINTENVESTEATNPTEIIEITEVTEASTIEKTDNSSDNAFTNSINTKDLTHNQFEDWVVSVLKYRESTPEWSFLTESPYMILIDHDGFQWNAVIKQDSIDGLNVTTITTFRINNNGYLEEYDVADDSYFTIATEYGDHGILPD
ncbi:MAG: hypothetical protein WAO56_12515 [Miniphocaeibacter sp.]|uniref:hypothetical protein n=1 Tax=Miniphocaeibacter sp. TaxID=3100973 RepID=UPI001839F4AF|nr:hypothetical protein [Gallicola sp.]